MFSTPTLKAFGMAASYYGLFNERIFCSYWVLYGVFVFRGVSTFCRVPYIKVLILFVTSAFLRKNINDGLLVRNFLLQTSILYF